MERRCLVESVGLDTQGSREIARSSSSRGDYIDCSGPTLLILLTQDDVAEVLPTSQTVSTPSIQDVHSEPTTTSSMLLPAWYSRILSDPLGTRSYERILPLLLRLSYHGYPIEFTAKEKWHFHRKIKGGKVIIDRPDTAKKQGFKIEQILGTKHALPAINLGTMKASDLDLATELAKRINDEQIKKRVLDLARKIHEEVDSATAAEDPWLKQLDWTLVSHERPVSIHPIYV